MTEKKILIIGAGVAGLAAGCYAQMNGYRSEIFELHDLPGGLCTSWERKGYTIDGCIHYLFGSAEGQPFHSLWQQLGASQGQTWINHDEYIRITDRRHTFIVYTDPDKLEEHLKALSPADSRLISEFCAGVRRFDTFDLSALQNKPRSLLTPQDWATLGQKMTPFTLDVAKWGMLSSAEFARKFKSPFLQRAVPHMFSWTEAPVMVGMSLLAAMKQGNAAYPIGGSLQFARRLERRYLELGGQIHYLSQVEKILVENDRAIGLRLYNDAEFFGDWVISAADGRTTIFYMLDSKYTDRNLRRMYSGRLPLHTQLQISLGVNRDLSSEPHWVTYLLDKPMTIAGQTVTELSIKHYCFDPGMAPKGKSVIEAMIRTNYHYWQRIYGRKLYDTEQDQVSELVIKFLESVYPGIKSQIEFIDEATPMSYERYTGNWMGATCGWLLTKQTLPMLIQGVDKTLPGLKNFFLAGQWVEPGGSLPLAASSGRNAIHLICHEDKKEFEPGHG